MLDMVTLKTVGSKKKFLRPRWFELKSDKRSALSSATLATSSPPCAKEWHTIYLVMSRNAQLLRPNLTKGRSLESKRLCLVECLFMCLGLCPSKLPL